VEGGQLLAQVIAPPGARVVGGGFTADKDIRAALSIKGQAGSAVIIYDGATRGLLPIIDPKTKKPIMDRRTKQVVPLPFPHVSEVERVFFSPDCSRFVSWSQDRMFHLFDVKEVRLVTSSSVAPGAQKALAVSPDFKRIMGSFNRANVTVYDVEAGTEVKEFKPAGVGSTDALAFGGENNIGVTATFGGPTCIYDLEEGTIKKEVKGVPFTTAIALTADSKTILCGDIGGTIHVFKLDE